MSREEHPVFKKLQERSKFFCPAKWNELYLYLNHGNSNSCHHPIPHAIPKENLSNPFVLHNTPHKLKMQKMMLEGERPSECHMCWHLEDSNPELISDRIIKSKDWETDIDNLQIDPYHIPKLIEVVFDNICNLGCSYCDAGQSSTWASRVKKTPIYLNTDYRNLYNTIHIKNGQSIDEYYQAWIDWWPKISHKVEVLRISGGEPLISPNFWNFMDLLEKTDTSHLNFRINSNMSVDNLYIEKFTEKTKKFNSVSISASIDAVEDIAEYARSGLDYKLFLKNVESWCKNSRINDSVKLQSTVNILNIWGLKEKLKLVLHLRATYGKQKIHSLYSTVVRFPEFQSILLLPDYLRKELVDDISHWLSQHKKYFFSDEISYIEKIISYLTIPPKSFFDVDKNSLLSDLYNFLQYYDQFSEKKYSEVFPENFVEWIDSLKFINNSTNSNKPVKYPI